MIGLRGEFHLVKRNALTHDIVEERNFQNMITNVGLIQFAKNNPGGGAMKISVGVGTTEPSPEDTSLTGIIATVDCSGAGTSNPVAPLYEYSASISCRFAAGRINGNISEIGVFYQNGVLWSRQLILDDQGQPSTLTVLPNEYLDVKYTLWYYPPLNDWSGTFEMNGETYSFTARVSGLPRYSNYKLSNVYACAAFASSGAYATQDLGEITSGPAGTNYANSTKIFGPTWGGNGEPYTWYGTMSLALGEWNAPGGIGSMIIGSRTSIPATQISFNPKLPKDANTTMTLVFSQSVGRYEP